MASIKFVVFTAVTLLLNCHWAKTQYVPGYTQVCYEDDDNDLDNILPIVILALLGRGRYGGCGGLGGFGACGGCGGCANCGGYGSLPGCIPIPYIPVGSGSRCGGACGGCSGSGGCGGCGN